ncbi:hypothetical protein D3C80_1350190 [compost metagenome]
MLIGDVADRDHDGAGLVGHFESHGLREISGATWFLALSGDKSAIVGHQQGATLQGIVRDVNIDVVPPMFRADQAFWRPLPGNQVKAAFFHTGKGLCSFGGVDQWLGGFGFFVAGQNLAKILAFGFETGLGRGVCRAIDEQTKEHQF